VLLAVGAGLNLQAVRERGGGDVDHADTLATAGLHGVTRNPMYLGWSLIHLGVGLATRSPWVVATWPLSVLLIHRLVVGEEVELAQRFGNEFEAYRSRVPRYLPHPR
jgi:protein-S-isoprenylcysteine O-methyltransferase Ste14